MPYKSEAQRRFFHTATAKKHGITGAEVKEFDQTSKGKKLPEKKGGSMFKANKSLFKPKGYKADGPTGNEKGNSSDMEMKAPEGEVKADHPFHKGGEGFHSLKHEESGHTHSISHHDDGIHHTISHPEHGEHHITHNPGQPSQMAAHPEDHMGGDLESAAPVIP